MCTINDPRILNAYIAITEDEPTDWLLLGYKDTRDVISLYASGVNGLSEFRDHLTNEILFGFVRVEEKFILITYVPDSVSGVRRARALVHSRAVAGILELSHAQFTASSLSDLSDANVRTRLKLGQLPNNRPRSRSSILTQQQQQRRRKSGTYSPSPSPSPISERNLKIHLYTTMTDEPYSYEDSSDRMTATPTPSTPTSVTSSHNNDLHYFSVADHGNDTVIDEQERKRIQEQTEAMLQFQLAKKKELEEARFRQFQREQQEERFKYTKRIEQVDKVQQLQQKVQQTQQREIPLWQQQLQQRKLLKQQQQQQQQQQPQQNEASLVKLRSVTPISQPTISKQRSIYDLKPVKREEATNTKQMNTHDMNIKRSSTLFEPKTATVIEEPTIVKQKSIQNLNGQRSSTLFEPTTTTVIEEPTIAKQKSIQNLNNQRSSTLVEPEPTTVIEEPVIVIQKSLQDMNQPIVPAAEPLAIIKKPEEEKVSAPASIVIIRTGFMSVQTRASPFWKRRYFTIDNKQLIIYKDELCKQAMNTIEYSLVKNVTPVDEDEDCYVPNSFMIHTHSSDTYQLLADDKKMSKEIYTTLKQLIK